VNHFETNVTILIRKCQVNVARSAHSSAEINVSWCVTWSPSSCDLHFAYSDLFKQLVITSKRDISQDSVSWVSDVRGHSLSPTLTMAWTKYQLFLAGLMLTTGSINTLSAK